jgi:hypothetical protein
MFNISYLWLLSIYLIKSAKSLIITSLEKKSSNFFVISSII